MQYFWVYPRAVCREVAKAYVHLRAGVRITCSYEETLFVLWTVLSPCEGSFLPKPLILSARGITLSTSEGQRWQHPGRHHHAIKFRVVDTCLRSQVLSSVKVSLAQSQDLLMCFMTHQATRLWPSPLHPIAVCGTDPSHLKPVNAIQWLRANWIRQWLSRWPLFVQWWNTCLATDILGYRKNDSLREEHRAWENLDMRDWLNSQRPERPLWYPWVSYLLEVSSLSVCGLRTGYCNTQVISDGGPDSNS